MRRFWTILIFVAFSSWSMSSVKEAEATQLHMAEALGDVAHRAAVKTDSALADELRELTELRLQLVRLLRQPIEVMLRDCPCTTQDVWIVKKNFKDSADFEYLLHLFGVPKADRPTTTELWIKFEWVRSIQEED